MDCSYGTHHSSSSLDLQFCVHLGCPSSNRRYEVAEGSLQRVPQTTSQAAEAAQHGREWDAIYDQVAHAR